MEVFTASSPSFPACPACRTFFASSSAAAEVFSVSAPSFPASVGIVILLLISTRSTSSNPVRTSRESPSCAASAGSSNVISILPPLASTCAMTSLISKSHNADLLSNCAWFLRCNLSNTPLFRSWISSLTTCAPICARSVKAIICVSDILGNVSSKPASKSCLVLSSSASNFPDNLPRRILFRCWARDIICAWRSSKFCFTCLASVPAAITSRPTHRSNCISECSCSSTSLPPSMGISTNPPPASN